MADHEIDLSGVRADDIAKVLGRAADLLDEHGWSPVRSTNRLTVLQAITKACDEVAGKGVDTAELHMAALDAICLATSGKPHGQGASVSRWERQLADSAYAKAIVDLNPTVISRLREAAA